jgi:GNAT superfamily N-acetyltransferase
MPIAQIRPATPEDTPALTRLRWEFSSEEARQAVPYHQFAGEFVAFWNQASAGGDWQAWVAERDGALIGNIYLQVIHKLPRPNAETACFGYITNMYIQPEYRQQGVGADLLQASVAWASAAGLQFLLLWYSAEGHPFYRRHGFVDVNGALHLPLNGWKAPTAP